MEVACSADYYWDNLDLQSFLSVVPHDGLFEWLVYVVYVGDGV